MHFWALCFFYEPFVMGGDVWQGRRYEVVGEAAESIDGFKTFSWENQQHRWQVHETTTGGLIAKGGSLQEAWDEAKKNIRETPDFADQVRKLGPVTNRIAVEYEEAMRRIAKSKREEKDGQDSSVRT